MNGRMPYWRNTKVMILGWIMLWAWQRMSKYGTPALNARVTDELAAWWADHTMHYIDPYRPVDQRIGMRGDRT